MPDRREYLDDIEDAIKLAIESELSTTWKALPCIVTSVNLVAQTIEARPAIQAKVLKKKINPAEKDTFVDVTLPLVVDCPIVWPRAGGYALTFPIAIGDEVLIIFGDKCIDGWWQSGEVAPQVEIRMHDLSDGFAILAPTSQPKKLSNVSSNSVQLRNSAGTCVIEINNDNNIIINSAGNIEINSADNIEINADATTTVSGQTVSISAENVIELSAPEISIEGDTVSISSGTFNISSDTISTSGGTASLVQEVVAGDAISVDNTDKQRPVVNNTAPG